MNFKAIKHPDDPDFLAAIPLYREAFPPEEQLPLATLQQRILSPQDQFLIAVEEGKVLAFAILHDLSGSRFTLLDYFAVHRSCRGNGLGSIFLKHLVQSSAERRMSLLAEIEDPDGGANREQRLSRIRFYQKNGFSFIDGLSSVVPAQQGTRHTPIQLMVHTANAAALRRDEMEKLVVSIFDEIYSLPAEHPLVQEVVAGIPDQCPISNQSA